jgi:metal-responsive CopG/Arc/MetJ family transcriptional regulator
MSTFTSSLPDDLLNRLNELSQKQTMPKNKIIEKALSIYLDQINKAEYIKSYKAAANDKEIMDIAEEGMIDYFNQLNQ